MWKRIALAAAAVAASVSVYTVTNQSSTSNNDENKFKLHPSKNVVAKDYEQVVNENNFKFEEHFVTTQDGYILSLWRIPGAIDENETETKKPPVLFLPGMMASCFKYIDAGPEKGPVFISAKAGYDVWCGNNRGVQPSLGHTTLNADKD